MKALLQRVSRAEVSVDGQTTGSIGQGLLILLCVEKEDGGGDAAMLAAKIAKMRIFSDADGRFNLSLLDVGGGALVISQFTLAADWRKGNRPSFSAAAPPETAEPLYRKFCTHLADLGMQVETGIFGAHMDVELVNDGPVSIWMDTERD